jgi:hypothetical protein
MRLEFLFWQVRNAQSRQCGLDDMSRGVEDELPVYPNVDLLATSLEIPDV